MMFATASTPYMVHPSRIITIGKLWFPAHTHTCTLLCCFETSNFYVAAQYFLHTRAHTHKFAQIPCPKITCTRTVAVMAYTHAREGEKDAFAIVCLHTRSIAYSQVGAREHTCMRNEDANVPGYALMRAQFATCMYARCVPTYTRVYECPSIYLCIDVYM
jgi:hypothetical protein